MKNLLLISILLFGMYSVNATEHNNNNVFTYSKINTDGSVSIKQQTKSIIPQKSMTRFINKRIVETTLTDANVEAQCKHFIANNSTINTDNLQLLAAKFKRNQWYVNFAQTHNGIRVLNAEIKLRLFENGNLLYVAPSYFHEIAQHTELARTDNIDTAAMKQIAIVGIDTLKQFQGNIKNLTFTFGEQYILPVATKNKTDFYVVQSVEFRNNIGNVAYCCYVDVATNKLFLRHNLIHNADYTIKSKVVDPEPTAPLVETTYFPYMDVEIDGQTYSADANGVITANDNLNGKEALLTFNSTNTITPLEMRFRTIDYETQKVTIITPFTEPITVSNNVFNDIDNLTHRIAATHYTSFFKLNDKFLQMDSDFKYLNIGFSIEFDELINLSEEYGDADDMANAYSDAGSSVVFVQPKNKKLRIGQMPGVLYHELGHGLNGLIYEDMGMSDGMISGALHEGLADVHSAMMLGYQDVFRGVTDNPQDVEGMVRYLKNNLKLDIDDIGQSHFDGQILSGSLWDFGELTSFDLMAELMHFTRFATPDGVDESDNRGAFINFLIQMLITDDDDGNLLNLTPHWNEITTAFDNHNISLAMYMKFHYEHTPLPLCTKDSANPYNVMLTIPFVNSILPVNDVYLHYSTDYGSRDSIKMFRMGDNYYAYIPKQPYYTAVNYHFSILSPFENRYVEMKTDMYGNEYHFFVGYDTLFYDGAIIVNGWTITPTSGKCWERVDANTAYNQNYGGVPKEDVTGDNSYYCISNYKLFNYGDKVDSSNMIQTFNVNSNYKNYVLLNYTLSSNVKNYTLPAFNVSIRDGNQSDWIETFNTSKATGDLFITPKWQGIAFCVNDYLENFNELQIKISAYGGSIYIDEIEFNFDIASCVDNILVLTSDPNVGIKEPLQLVSSQVYPNPASGKTTLSLEIASTCNIQIELVDVLGQEVLPIYDGLVEAGSFTRSFNTAKLAKGIYFVKIIIGSEYKLEKLVIN